MRSGAAALGGTAARRGGAARGLALFVVLLAAYATTLGLNATPRAERAPGEALQLLTAESIVSDGDVDLRDELRSRAYARWTGGAPLNPVAGLTAGRLDEVTGVGLGLVVAGPYALAGATGAELAVAALLALGFVAAAALARRLVPDPWATAAVAVAGLSPPALAWSTTVSPEPVAAAVVAIAAIAALRVREEPTLHAATTTAIAIAALPWLGVKFVGLAAVLALALARWMGRRRRALAGFVALEVVLSSAVAYLTANERLYGGLTPYAAAPDSPTGARGVLAHLERAPRLVAAWLDPATGLLVWAPFGVLAALALVLLARSRRERLAVALPAVVDREVAAGLLAALCATQLLVAAFLAPALAEPAAFPGRELLCVLPLGAALAAWGLRHAPRAGAALAAPTLAASAWFVLGARLGGATLAPPRGPLPYAGAEPAVAVLVALALLGLVGRELWRERTDARGADAAALSR